MTGFIPKSEKNRPVNKRILVSAAFVVIAMFGSFSLRELFPQHPIIKKFFGGYNILLFWAGSFYAFHKLDLWIFHIGESNVERESLDRERPLITKKVVILASIPVILFFASLKFLEGVNIVLFWSIFIAIFWVFGQLIDRQRKRIT